MLTLLVRRHCRAVYTSGLQTLHNGVRWVQQRFHNIVTDLLKALRNSGHAVPQQDDATVLWKRFLRFGACTSDVMIYGAYAGDVSSDCATVGDRLLLGGRQRTNEMPGLWRVRDATIERMSQAVFTASPLGALGDYISEPTKLNAVRGEARHRKYKRLKLGGGQAYDRSSA
jgi:hypothetical protein